MTGAAMFINTLGRYFAGRFVTSAVGVFVGMFVLLVLVDYIDLLRTRRRTGTVSALDGRADLAVTGCRNCSKG